MNIHWIKEREIQLLKGCKLITVLNNKVYYVDKKMLIQQVASESAKNIDISFPANRLIPVGEKRIFIDGPNIYAWYDRDSHTIHKFDQRKFSLGRINRSVTIGISSEFISYAPVIQKHFLINLLTGQTIAELEGDARFQFSRDNLYYLGKKDIRRIDLQSGKVIKTYPYHLSEIPLRDGNSKESFVDKVLGEIEGKLLLSGSNERYLSIDLENNIKNQEISNPYFEMKSGFGIFPNANKSLLDYDKGEIVGLHNGKLWSVEVSTGVIAFEDLSNLLEAHKLPNASLIHLEQDLLYILDKFNGGIGIYDRKVRNVVWSYDIQGLSGNRPLNLSVYDRHLLVHDSSNCIHVFVRQ